METVKYMETAEKTTKPRAKKPAKAALPKAQSKSENKNAFAVIKTGGKQYLVKEGDTITIEKISGDFKEGDKITFNEVLLTGSGDDLKFGAPMISGGVVEGELTSIGRNAKVIVIKYKQKSRYFKKNGHRQPHFKVKINSIS